DKPETFSCTLITGIGHNSRRASRVCLSPIRRYLLLTASFAGPVVVRCTTLWECRRQERA
ncbi:MAG: hypothetical protein V3V86_03680, partial [Gammaproteobacteria bacterium]